MSDDLTARLVEAERSARSEAELNLALSARAAARAESVDEKKLLGSLKLLGRTAESFARDVAAIRDRAADVLKVRRLGEIERARAARKAAQEADDEALAPVLAAHRQREAVRAWENTSEGQEVYALLMLKNELARTSPNRDIANAREAEEDRLHSLERELQRVRDAKDNAEAKTDRRYPEDVVAEAKVSVSRYMVKIEATRAAIEEAKVTMARLDEELAAE